jgi:spore germination cell wall hydrolase CwlJ-like protein
MTNVVIVSKKAHSALKVVTVILAFIALVSIGVNIKMLVDVRTYEHAYVAATEALGLTSKQLEDVTKEKDELAKTVEKRKIAMISSSREAECLATNIYFEAGSESLDGKKAVAHVVVNRMKNPEFPKTACGVVYQGANTGTRSCQFSWACDGMNKAVKFSSEAWQESKQIAIAVLSGKKDDVTGGALYFHNTTVRPKWATRDKFLVQIGGHKFYR